MTQSSDDRNCRTHRLLPEFGQGTAELALLLPVLLLITMVVVQIGLIGRDYVLIQHAVRETARQAALDPGDGAAVDAAAAAVPGLDPSRISVGLSGGQSTGDVLTVELTYRATTSVPVVGQLLGDVAMSSTASVRVE